jgi:hypothetical protein
MRSSRSRRAAVRGLALAALIAGPAPAFALPAAPPRSIDGLPGLRADRIVAPHGFFGALDGALARTHEAALGKLLIPSFSRQTKLPCSACHYQFPQLTPFGRLFKLNGYTLTGLIPITASDSSSLKLAPIPPASAMLVVSTTHTATAEPGKQNNTTSFPQEASLFLGGQVTPNVGAFTQFTYTPEDERILVDNIDVRYATHLNLGARDWLLGVTLHNNPTVQDVWNTTPAWGYPFVGSSVAPSPSAAPLIDDALAQQVLGLGAYTLVSSTVYAEATMYRSAPQGSSGALDSSAVNATNGVIPYWRLALQHQWPTTYLMVGTYGFSANVYPAGVSGTTNRYTDVGLDAQVEHAVGTTTVIGRATYIHEQQRLDAFATAFPPEAERAHQSLSTVRANVGILPSQRFALNLGYFQTTGTRDTLLFAPESVTGSRTGSPRTAGEIGELVYNPWQNFRLGLQYTLYNEFNGGRTAYDLAGGRRASDNDALYLYAWLAF